MDRWSTNRRMPALFRDATFAIAAALLIAAVAGQPAAPDGRADAAADPPPMPNVVKRSEGDRSAPAAARLVNAMR